MAAEKKPKSRRELRKEARKDKNQKKFDSWIQRQKTQKEKKLAWKSKQKNNGKVSDDSSILKPIDDIGEILEMELDDNKAEKPSVVKGFKGKKKATNSKFEKYLAMEGMTPGVASAEEDRELERRLAKKLKVKGNKLGGMDDGMDMFLEGIPSAIDSFEHERLPKKTSKKKSISKKIKSPETDQDGGSDMSGETKDAISEAEEACYEAEQSTGEEKEKVKRSKVKRNATDVSNSSMVKSGKKKKTNFEKYLELTKQGGSISAEADLYLERKLAKKLKVKNGKLGGLDDDINMLIEGIPSVLDMLGSEEGPVNEAQMKTSVDKSSRKKRKRVKTSDGDSEEQVATDTVDVQSDPADTSPCDMKLDNATPAKASGSSGSSKYVAPHLRSRENESDSQIRRRVRGLLNRLSESNVESITGEMSTIFRSLPRVTGTQIISEEVLASCSGGPRGNEQYAAVFAAFVAGMSCLVGIDFGAKVLASLAKCFEDEYRKEDNLSLRNLTLLLSYLYILGVCSSDLIYDFVIMLSKRLTEADVSTILTILQSCGMNLRGDDPAAMKDFVMSIQNRANELKSSENNGQSISSKRMEFMLETICDIKNNKRKAREDTPQHTRIKKWLQKMSVEQILIRGLKWSKLVDPDKKGQWWMSGDMVSTTSNIEEVANTIDKESLEAQKLLQLAAAQRMNTDVRRAIFCIIMSGEDYVDAFEKLLRLNLQGKQDREITRVLVDCCLQENVFNKYYCVLATKLCSYDRNHRMSLQNCLWDHFEQLESMPLTRSSHLAQFVAEMLVSFTLSLAALKKVDFSDPRQLTNRRIVHFRMLFQALFKQPDKLVWNVFTRIAAIPELEDLRSGIGFFIKEYVVVGEEKPLADKFKVAKKALANLEGILM